jgi:hypothetical protein
MKLLQTKYFNTQFFDEFVDLQKPIETLHESLSENVFDLNNLIKGKIVLDFLKGADEEDEDLLGEDFPQNHDGDVIVDFDHSSLIAFNERIENEISTLEILEAFVEWVDNKYPYSEEISNAVLSLIEEVYEEWNRTSDQFHEISYYNLDRITQKDKSLSYLVLHTSENGDTIGASIDSEVTIHFL